MASKAQIAWRKKFAKLYGKNKKKGAIDPNRYGSKKIKKKTGIHRPISTMSKVLLHGHDRNYHERKLKELGYSERTIHRFLKEEFG